MKNRRKIDEKSMQIWNLKKTAQKSHKNWFWEGLGPHLGRVWDGLGPLLGALGRLWVVFWTFKIQLFSSMGPRWAPRGLLDRFWVDLGKDLGGFWKDLGRFGEEFGSIFCFLSELWADFGSAWHDLALLGQIL